MNKNLLEIKDLWVNINDKPILKGINLSIAKGESHVIFGRNGSGKSTLLGSIIGLPHLKIVKGDILFKGKSILNLPMYERIKMGIGIIFQRPPTIKGVKLEKLLQIINRSKENIQNIAKELKLHELLKRDVNDGFSGGEIKASEIMQLFLQNPDLLLLDEPDAGVDADNIKIISNYINKLLQADLPKERREKSAIIIVHSGIILEYVNIDIGHVMVDGKLTPPANPYEILDMIKKFGYKKCYEYFSKGKKNGE
ncbi:Fe-S cluster assembly ATP-binding protein [Lebetimonas natsushimae]|uniref:Fe-S cluster assembly ATP-binding protein n=1 Tax=Lebetimonas natsushimae TaxID=1936991 RepID=A0A292YAU1_9BACT|nr:ABC transporter ATP-binding protein [Lebetimonas natsushimae]GAX87187.1 Fe-S cluster assembly ATP-binding protein [Lebetimonas natsushimae]